MKKYNKEYSLDAKQELIEIKQYIKYNLQEPEIAQKLILKIRKEISTLKNNPEIYTIIDDDIIKKLEIRDKRERKENRTNRKNRERTNSTEKKENGDGRAHCAGDRLKTFSCYCAVLLCLGGVPCSEHVCRLFRFA